MAKQVKDRCYALDLLNPTRHLRTAIDTAAGSAVSARAVAQTYVHPNAGDLTRVKKHEKQANDDEAHLWMIKEAALQMKRWLSSQEVEGETWISLKTNARSDQLKIYGVKVLADTNPNAVFDDLFDPNRQFAVNVRVPNQKDDDTELEES